MKYLNKYNSFYSINESDDAKINEMLNKYSLQDIIDIMQEFIDDYNITFTASDYTLRSQDIKV